MENKFDDGQLVYAKAYPEVKLIVKRGVDRMYYCKLEAEPTLKSLVYFEQDLVAIETEEE